MKVLVIGATGMLGSAVFRHFSAQQAFETHGTIRSASGRRHFSPEHSARLHPGIDALDFDSVVAVFGTLRPNVVVNAVGLIKQLEVANDVLSAVPINTLFPHRLERLCNATGTRLIHISTDCVFSGRRGQYLESDQADADDIYGRSKLLGEVESDGAVTLRTSIIGHELDSAHALLEWFLAQSGSVRGFTKAVFSGLPTVELARVIERYVIPNHGLSGVYHVAGPAINKHDLLHLVRDTYSKNIEIHADDQLVIDRSLVADRFNSATGYRPADWRTLIREMKDFGK